MQRVLSMMLIVLLGFGASWTYAQPHDEHMHEHAMGEMTMHGEEEYLGICPVMKGGPYTTKNIP